MKRPLRPRFSLSNLLMLIVVVGLSLAWYDQRRKLGEQADAIEEQRLEIIRLTVNNILRSDVADTEKVKLLEPFVKLHDPVVTVAKWVKCESQIAALDGGYYGEVTFSNCDLSVGYDNDDLRIYSIGYLQQRKGNQRKFVELIRDRDYSHFWPPQADR